MKDCVTFYSRVTNTLENCCGRGALAERLARLRRDAETPAVDGAFLQAMHRWFRRLGRVDGNTDMAGFVRAFAAETAAAVSRGEEQVFLLLRLFALGEDGIGLKPVCGSAPQCHACLLTRECDFFNTPRKPEMATLSPARRMAEGGAEALSDAELLSLVLHGQKATGREPVVTTLLARYGRLRALFRAEGREFSGFRDMTKPQALLLSAVGALHKRLLAEKRNETLRISSARDIFDRYAAELRDFRVEAAVLLILDQQNSVVRDVWFCEGAPNMSFVPVAELLRPAVREYAVRIALAHNHPGNDPSPSLSDLDYTRRLRGACDMLGIGLVDHVIIAESGYFSFAEEGMLEG
jgi:DNA repair protein RadC